MQVRAGQTEIGVDALAIDDQGFAAALDLAVHDFSWRRFAAIQIWIFTCFLIYVTATEVTAPEDASAATARYWFPPSATPGGSFTVGWLPLQ